MRTDKSSRDHTINRRLEVQLEKCRKTRVKGVNIKIQTVEYIL